MSNEPIIDVWCQHPTPSFLAHEMFASLRRWIGMDKIPEQIPIANTLSAMAAGGVNQALLSAWWGPQGPILSNADVYKVVQDHPDRLFGVASVDLYRPVEAVRELRRCVRDLGFRAVRVVPWLWNLPPDDRLYYPLYAECVELEIPFCLQVGHTGPMRPSEPGRPIPYLDRVALDFPDLTIVAGHIGFPWTNEMISLATKYPNVYIDTSAYKASRYPQELVAYMQGHGRKKVMFGTNFPMIQFADALRDIQSLGLDDDARRLFLFENARRVFNLK